jgi:hypothetical protein
MRESASTGEEVVSVDIARTSKYVWTVTGTFDGIKITVSAASKRAAISRWRREAEGQNRAQITSPP